MNKAEAIKTLSEIPTKYDFAGFAARRDAVSAEEAAIRHGLRGPGRAALQTLAASFHAKLTRRVSRYAPRTYKVHGMPTVPGADDGLVRLRVVCRSVLDYESFNVVRTISANGLLRVELRVTCQFSASWRPANATYWVTTPAELGLGFFLKPQYDFLSAAEFVDKEQATLAEVNMLVAARLLAATKVLERATRAAQLVPAASRGSAEDLLRYATEL